jgi:transketolase
VGDGELNEGSNWEAFMAAGHHKLGNLVALVDKNQVQASGLGKDIMDIDPLAEKIRAFGWNVAEVDGHDMAQLCDALESLPPADPRIRRKPNCIICNTVKGKGVPFMELNPNYHMNSITKQQYDEAIASIESMRKGIS